jgi:hypothetical protein
MFQRQPAPEIVHPHLVGLPPLLWSLLRRPTRHSGLLGSTGLVRHELVRAGTWLVRVLAHTGVSRIASHSVHSLILLNRRSVHRSAALDVMQLRRSVHGRLLRVGRLLWRPLCILLHIVLLGERRGLRRTLPHV